MKSQTPFEQIASLRVQRGETLAQFALAVGISSKGRISEMEKGLVRPTVAQALAIEKLSGGSIDAAALNTDVAASRQTVIEDQSEPGSWADAIAHSPNMLIEDYSQGPVIVCDVCEQKWNREIPSICTFADCPHFQPKDNFGIAA